MPGLDPGTHAAYRRARRAVGRGGGAGGWPDQVRPWVPGSSPGMTGVSGVGGVTGRRSGGRAPRGAARWNLRRAHRRPPASCPSARTLPMLPCCPTSSRSPRHAPPSSCPDSIRAPMRPLGAPAGPWGGVAAPVGGRIKSGHGWPEQVRPWVAGTSPTMTGRGRRGGYSGRESFLIPSSGAAAYRGARRRRIGAPACGPYGTRLAPNAPT